MQFSQCRLSDRTADHYRRDIVKNSQTCALRDSTYDLKTILLEGRRAEQSAYQACEIESQQPTQDDLPKINSKPSKHTTCQNCGGTYPREGQCPAQGKQCHKCGKYKQ